MNYLTRGGEREEVVRLLLQIPKVTSNNLKNAVVDYLVKGYSQSAAAILHDVQQPHISSLVKRLDGIYGIYGEIKAIENNTR